MFAESRPPVFPGSSRGGSSWPRACRGPRRTSSRPLRTRQSLASALKMLGSPIAYPITRHCRQPRNQSTASNCWRLLCVFILNFSFQCSFRVTVELGEGTEISRDTLCPHACLPTVRGHAGEDGWTSTDASSSPKARSQH